MGKVVTRFPPEPSGFLHIGHAKAALLNNHFARKYEGKLIIRFDDTNPSKEKEEYVDNILADLKRLDIVPDLLTHTSDHFERIQQIAEDMIKNGTAYVDDTPVEQMREERLKKIESKNRNNTVEQNMALWQEMIKGSQRGQQCCLRAKVDMRHKNGCMRDPTLYRCDQTPHHRTGTKYKMYPTYDFACPIVDSVEGVTHALRSSEYTDRKEQYEWFLDHLKLRKVNMWEFSRLNFVYTLLSKRKLQWFVDKKMVEGWADPRFPTVQGMKRRGLTIEALQLFVLSQGASRNLNLMEWDKLWTINKKVIDPICPRYVAFNADSLTPFILEDGPETVECKSILRHKKNESLGHKITRYYKNVFLDTADANEIALGEEITLMDWGNAFVNNIVKDADGKITRLEGKLNPDGDFKKTSKKLTWVVNHPDEKLTEVKLVDLDHLITKKKLEESENFEDFVNPTSRTETAALGDPNLRLLTLGQHIQLERRGYYIVDQPYIGPDKPLVLIYIPDGRVEKKDREENKNEKDTQKQASKERAAAEKKEKKEKKKGEKPAAAAAAAAATPAAEEAKN
eukprot:TRINITY_DN4201_c0_g1::TRINITY_DN4201_c0_g1_i1::g.2092::m.2092 TRINITY_DN4201_c0_g1::TRINITY_DN4201_c0_g1_i1::g.2092  ORF type:complete len:618 (+),score=257.86,sp/O82462/SYEC_ARATH/57.03/0.0,tRNA-synt_1c/PF00749.16/1.4e-103,tRNA-synt_1c/PF00749.16/1.8e+03,tRNA-synt_1c_C/PF03950.13/7.7e-31,tRNA-synt_1c_C/PF03950.13/1.5e+04,tRNA-synt_1e/PF01406.14/0.0064,tRNA-synt_1e/PF01406.14/1.5e+04 TRINITY_DN4201_c0_g1_i1:156-1856(+)